MKLLTLQDCLTLARRCVTQMISRGIATYKGRGKGKLYYVPQGGLRAAQLIAMVLEDRGLRLAADIVVDDISCTGKTLQDIKNAIGDRAFTCVLVLRRTSCFCPDFFGYIEESDEYVLFPWEVGSVTVESISAS